MRIIDKNYKCIPTLESFHESGSKVRLIVGPFRSGKSVATVIDLRAMAHDIDPYSVPSGAVQDNIICRTVCVRATYPRLMDSVVKTFFQWIPKEHGQWWEQQKRFLVPLGNGFFWEVLFRSAESEADIDEFKGMELTNYWLDEAKELSSDVKMILTGRCSYPAGLKSVHYRGILTTNPTDDEHWIYNQFVSNPLPGHSYWKQGAGENPYLTEDYYENLRLEYRDRPDLLKMYIDGDWGSSFSGKPVYGREFSRTFHVASAPIKPIQGVELARGWDFGLTPACVVTQVAPEGTWLVLKELYSDDMGIDEFSDTVIEVCNRAYPSARFVDVGDPAGRQRSQTDQKTCMDILRSKKINCRAALTNDLIPRISAVKRQLSKTDKGRPRVLIDPGCKRLISGFDGGYKYVERKASDGEKSYTDTPEKNKYSHVHDALQYIAMALFGHFDYPPDLFREPLPNQLGVVNA